MLGGRKKIVLSGVIAMIGMFFVSCSSEGRSNLALYTVERGAFDDVLRIEGFTESVSSISLTCPQDADGSIDAFKGLSKLSYLQSFRFAFFLSIVFKSS